MSAPGQSVFISYAREDLAAARRIADALSAFEVEVWFDEAGLEGGDAWDQKIRRQVKGCSLFIPIISAQTQARREAYFRLEWKLAEERTHLMAEGTAFLLPIAIDHTPEDGALVPESFQRTQWMRLPRGVPDTSFIDRVRALLEAQRQSPIGPAQAAVPGTARPTKKWPWSIVAAAAAIMAAWSYWPRGSDRPAAVPPIQHPTAVAAVVVKSIAVLPFTNMSDDKDSGYFADGVHEDILTNLTNVGALRVISRTSMMQYRDSKKSIHQIADELGVAYLLEGSVRRSGNKVRVTGQLIRAATDEHVWAKTYDRDLTDVFVIQTELSHEIALALQAVLTPRENARLEERPTQSVEAYELYQQALTLMRRGVEKVTLDQALPLLSRAVEIDPNYAKAWAAISKIHGRAYWRENKSPVRLASMREALTRAEKSDPNDYNVLEAGAGLGAATGDRALVNHYLQRIIELFPNRTEAYLALALAAHSEQRWADALAGYAKARLLDPFNVELLARQADTLRSLRHFAEGEEIERILVRLNPEDNDAALRLARTPFRRMGSTRELGALLAKFPAEFEKEDPFVHYTRLEVMIELGDADGMIRLWRASGGDAVFRDYSEREARMLVAEAYLSKKDFASARPLMEKNRDSALTELAVNPAAPGALNDLGLALAILGDQEAGRAKLTQAREILRQMPPDQEKVARFLNAINRAWAGEKAEAVAGLTEILRSPLMAKLEVNVYRLRYSLLTLPLRGDPVFEAMLNDPKNNAPLF